MIALADGVTWWDVGWETPDEPDSSDSAVMGTAELIERFPWLGDMCSVLDTVEYVEIVTREPLKITIRRA